MFVACFSELESLAVQSDARARARERRTFHNDAFHTGDVLSRRRDVLRIPSLLMCVILLRLLTLEFLLRKVSSHDAHLCQSLLSGRCNCNS